MKCRICNINDANQTGAHIFPAWMIASALDLESRNRDFEIIFDMDFIGSKLPYFGRRVTVKKIDELIGRKITDEEGQSQSNCLTVDKIWCRECESKIKIVEDYFLENIERKRTEFSRLEDVDSICFSEANKYIVRLFIFSLVFRAYLSGKFNLKLTKRTSKKLQVFLNKYLKSNLQETIDTIEYCDNKEQLLKFPYRLIKVETEQPAKTFIFVHRNYTRPYSFILNDYILQFYGKGNHIKFKKDSFFGISLIIKNFRNIRNYNEDEFCLGIFKLNNWLSVRTIFYELQADKWIEENRILFRRIYRIECGIYPSEAKVKDFLVKVTDNELPLHVKNSRENVIKTIKMIINE